MNIVNDVVSDTPPSAFNAAQMWNGSEFTALKSLATDTLSILPAASSPLLIDGNLSVSHARDGQTITVGYQINSEESLPLVLDCTIIGPEGIAVQDGTNAISVNVAAGTQWYTRSFAINLPPTATVGAYNVTWTIHGQSIGNVSLSRIAALTIDAPVSVRIPTVMYHNVAKIPYDYWTVTISQFTAQMRVLKAYGYTAVTTQDVMDYRAGIKTPPAKPILITFDDGYESLFRIVSPILADPTINYRATVFVDTVAVRPEEDPGGYPTDFLSWSQIRQLQASGRWDIQSHTVNHEDLTTLDPATLRAELVDSKNILQQELGGTPMHFVAYPYGASNATVEMAAWQAGYSAGFRVDDEVELTTASKFALKRVQMDMETSIQLDQSGWYEFFIAKIGDPDIDIPDLSVTGVQYLDPITKNPIDLLQVKRGQTLLIKVNVYNAAAPAEVIATMLLGSGGISNKSAIYNSHTATPCQDIRTTCPWAVSSFEWTWTVPRNLPAGQYHLNVRFYDPHYVLIFKESGWLTKLQISASPLMSLPQSSPVQPSGMPTFFAVADNVAAARDAVASERSILEKTMPSATVARLEPSLAQSFASPMENVRRVERSDDSSGLRAGLHDAVLAKESHELWLMGLDSLFTM